MIQPFLVTPRLCPRQSTSAWMLFFLSPALLLATISHPSQTIASDQQPTATGHDRIAEINRRLGRGINMGNMFEAPAERAWGNPWQTGYFKRIADLGFTHVRIPVRWETPERSLAEPPYTIKPEFFQRIQQVVDEALEQKLMVVLNMHHHQALFEDPDGQRQRFITQWRQIAEHFKDYPDTLVFELLNEPHAKLTAEKWNDFLADGLRAVRVTNPNRAVMIGTAEWGGLSALPKLKLPDDPNLILTVHFYEPFHFTHQGAGWVDTNTNAWLGTRWMDTAAERQTIRQSFAAAVALRERTGIPIHVGEFGAYSRADMDSRVRWTRFLARTFDQQGFSWAYWEFSAGFGIFDRETQTYRMPLVNALLHDKLPLPTAVRASPLLKYDFAKQDHGWDLRLHAGAKASSSISPQGVTILIEKGGEQPWHIQWARSGVKLEKDATYQIRFSATVDQPRTIQVYTGQASPPWTNYSGFQSFTLTAGRPGEQEPHEFSLLFTMRQPTDEQARIVVDLGRTPGRLTLRELVLEQIQFVPADSDRPSQPEGEGR